MPHRARLTLPNVPMDIIQRGNCRQACFFADDDRYFYRAWLQDYANKTDCEAHARVLMTNHVHLMVCAKTGICASASMQGLGQRYAQYANHRYRRTGPL
jgi:putative transposase